MTTRLTTAVVEAQAQVIANLLDGAEMRIYSGTQPIDANAGVSMDATLLATLNFGTPAIASVTNGLITANPLTGGTAVSDGEASWFRIYAADGTTPILDGGVGTTNNNLQLTTTTITTGVVIEITSWTHQVIKSHSASQT
jgi:hypothetical protein